MYKYFNFSTLGQKAREAHKTPRAVRSHPHCKSRNLQQKQRTLPTPRIKLSLLPSAMTGPTLLFQRHNLAHSKLPSQERARPAQKAFKAQFPKARRVFRKSMTVSFLCPLWCFLSICYWLLSAEILDQMHLCHNPIHAYTPLYYAM